MNKYYAGKEHIYNLGAHCLFQETRTNTHEWLTNTTVIDDSMNFNWTKLKNTEVTSKSVFIHSRAQMCPNFSELNICLKGSINWRQEECAKVKESIANSIFLTKLTPIKKTAYHLAIDTEK